MKTFTHLSNCIFLHHALSGIELIFDNQPVEWINVSNDRRNMYAAAIVDLQDTTEYEGWYADYWRLFPFGEPNFDNLCDLKKDMVMQIVASCEALAEHYNARLRDVNE